jgi:hypothetical protein
LLAWEGGHNLSAQKTDDKDTRCAKEFYFVIVSCWREVNVAPMLRELSCLRPRPRDHELFELEV